MGCAVSNTEVMKYNGEVALVKADLTSINNLSRDETRIFVEFTEKNFVYSELVNYRSGEKKTYRGVEYYITQKIGDNGEPQFKIYFYYNGVKYYFDIQSTDENVYLRYLQLVIK